MDIIEIKSGLYDYMVEFVDDFTAKIKEFAETTAYVIDKNVYELYEEKFADIEIDKIYLMQADEHHKNMDTVMEIMTFWQRLGVRKDWKVVCFGGGISQDVTTIASNLFLRNVEWFFFPTTLLSMCDSCIGGKCGINFGKYKNQIGVFYPPRKIFIDIGFINTLSGPDYINGWGEILKFSLTGGISFYEQLKREKQYIPCERIEEYIHKGLLVKKIIIEEDEFEANLRRVLNYGHTFGHALEAYTRNEVPHGKAVIWGIDVANYIAWKEKLITEEFYLDVKKLIKKAFIPEEIVIEEADTLFEIIKTDKKVKGNAVCLALPDAPGHLIIYPMNIDSGLKGLLKAYIEETHEYYRN